MTGRVAVTDVAANNKVQVALAVKCRRRRGHWHDCSVEANALGLRLVVIYYHHWSASSVVVHGEVVVLSSLRLSGVKVGDFVAGKEGKRPLP